MKKNTNYKLLFGAVCLLVNSVALYAQEYVYVYKRGQIVFEELSSSIDNMALESNKSNLVFYGADNAVLFTTTITDLDSIAFEVLKPTADILDVAFKADGTAEDISLMRNEVTKEGTTATTYYNETYKRYVGKFVNPYGGTASGYYKMDFEEDEGIREMIADGHTLEALFMAQYDGTIENKEGKFFAAHQAGGTGFLISKIDANTGRQNEITFLPNVSTTGTSTWKWTNSGVVPQSQVYYHAIGVWNKDLNKAYIYINGVLMKEIDTEGDLNFASEGANWFGIGCDSKKGDGHCAWTGDVVLSRVYDAPLNQKQVDVLWGEVKALQDAAK